MAVARLITALNAALSHPESYLYSVIYSRFIAIADVPEVLYHEASTWKSVHKDENLSRKLAKLGLRD